MPTLGKAALSLSLFSQSRFERFRRCTRPGASQCLVLFSIVCMVILKTCLYLSQEGIIQVWAVAKVPGNQYS